MKIKLKNLILEATLDDLVKTPAGSEAGGDDGATDAGSEDPKDVQKLTDKFMNNQSIKLAIKRINMKTEVAPAIIAFANLLNQQVPGSLTSARRQQIIKALRDLS